jgi:hypothetical protein
MSLAEIDLREGELIGLTIEAGILAILTRYPRGLYRACRGVQPGGDE